MKLFKLLWTRYQRTMIILLIAIVGSFAITTITQIKDWNEVKTYMTSQEFATDFAKNPENFVTSRNAQNTIPKTPIETMIEKGTSFWQPPHDGIIYAYKSLNSFNVKSASEQHIQLIILVVIFALIGIFGSLSLDNSSHFNGLLLSTKYTRKQILATKMLILVGGPLLFTILGEIVYYASVYMTVPAKYLDFANQNLSVIVIINAFISYLILAMLLFVTTGIIGSTFWAGALYVCFILSGVWSVSATNNYFHFIGPKVMTRQQLNAFSKNFLNALDSWPGTLGASLIAIGLIVWAFYLFKKMSLERSGQFILFEKLRWPLWWFTLGYTMYSILGVIIYDTLDISVIAWGVIAIIAINVMMYFLIFKPQSLRHPIKSIQ